MSTGDDDTQDKQVSEGGGAFSGSETEVGGADAVPDKSTGVATGDEQADLDG